MSCITVSNSIFGWLETLPLARPCHLFLSTLLMSTSTKKIYTMTGKETFLFYKAIILYKLQ